MTTFPTLCITGNSNKATSRSDTHVESPRPNFQMNSEVQDVHEKFSLEEGVNRQTNFISRHGHCAVLLIPGD